MNELNRIQFYVSKTKTDGESGNIIALFVCGKNESQWCWAPVEFVVQLINQGVRFNTFFKVGEGSYQVGARVEVHEFALRTNPKGAQGDTLESLPTKTV
ncbi:hypothetical protein PS850_02534 [Pseudomonas fluorescens]|nr:hypothetical protein PS850_02534 [Pseudomonas fluorescens]